jgi:NAD(P)H-hydrate repair Nnr-like enzyme with NAD(P)H-hydrate dehydratase domain
MLLIAGTVPSLGLHATMGRVEQDGNFLIFGGERIPSMQGTTVMISAALATTRFFGLEPPYALVAGDAGDGGGTREIYDILFQKLPELAPKVVTLHYCLPVMGLIRRFLQAVDKCKERPFLIADAGAMYAAKAAGLAKQFDIFTPDPSEIAYLADGKASHPAYVSEHLIIVDSSQVPQEIADAYKHGDTAKLLLVKGKTDYVAKDGKVLATINQPNIPALEPIGGTGDTITGLISGLVYAGIEPEKAAVIAFRTNRVAGELAQPTPATKSRQIVEKFGEALKITTKET